MPNTQNQIKDTGYENWKCINLVNTNIKQAGIKKIDELLCKD